MPEFVLEKASATKLQTGIYTWPLSHQNTLYRPKRITFGPVSITTSTDQRNLLIHSDDFVKSDRSMVRMGDVFKPLVTAVHPHQRFKHEYSQVASSTSVATIEAAVTYWLDMSSLTFFTNENWVSPAAVGDGIQHVMARKPPTGVRITTGARQTLMISTLV